METGLGPDWHIPVTASGVPQPYDGAEVAAKTMMMPLALPFPLGLDHQHQGSLIGVAERVVMLS